MILILDRVSDVGNFGAICRSAECAGVNAILIPTKGSAQVNSFAVKSSAGAIFNIPICRTNHFLSEVRELSESGLRLVAVSEKGEKSIYQSDLSGPMAIIMGSEEDGIGDGLMDLAHEHFNIPMVGSTGSLNVSVATGITLFERLRQSSKMRTGEKIALLIILIVAAVSRFYGFSDFSLFPMTNSAH